MTRVFLSYSRKDESLIVSLERDLEEFGVPAWIDKELTGGQAWWDRILQNIRECDCFLLALSTSSLASDACRRESAYATALGKPVLPVLITEGVATKLLPPALSAIQFVDYRAQDKKAFIALTRAIGAVPAARALPDPLPEPPPVPLSYLSGLGVRVENSAALSFEQQSALVLELKRGLRSGEDVNDVRQLLGDLRKRNDLLAAVAQEIDELLDFPKPEHRPTDDSRRRKPDPPPEELKAQTDRSAFASGMLVELPDAPQRLIDLVAQLRTSQDCWDVRADAHTVVVLSNKDGRCEAKACYDAYFLGKARQLQALGWRQDAGDVFGSGIGFVAVYCSLGLLLFSERFRKQLRRKVFTRRWPAPSHPNEHVDISQSVLATLRLLAPAVQRYSFEVRKGSVDEGSWGKLLSGG